VPDAVAVFRDLGGHFPNATRDWRLQALRRKQQRIALTREPRSAPSNASAEESQGGGH